MSAGWRACDRRGGRSPGRRRRHRVLTRLVTAVAVTSGIVTTAGACARGGQAADPPKPARAKPAVTAYVTADEQPRTLPSAVTELSPVWYVPTTAGGLSDIASAAQRRELGEVARRARVRLHPTVNNYLGGRWDGNAISRILATPALRATHVHALVNLARASGYAGIDLDYEDLPPTARDAFTAFVRELARGLHARGAALSVAVPAVTATPGPGEYGYAYDYAALGAAADQLRVMTYDHAWSTSSPGPIAPASWVGQVLGYALTQAPAATVRLGLAGYGYDWVGTRGSDVSATDALALARSRGVPLRRQADKPWFSYTRAGVAHTVWFEDARSVAPIVALATRHHVGVFLWKLGGEDPGLWTVLARRSPP